MRTKRVLVALVAVLLTACSTATEDAGANVPEISVSHAFVLATDAAMAAPYMTAAFMTLKNTTDHDMTLTGGTAAWAEMTQIHEVVDGVMRQKAAGLFIPSGSSVDLQMGGNHIMFMGIASALAAGDEVAFTLEFEDGTVQEVTAPVKTSNAGKESYAPTPMATESGM